MQRREFMHRLAASGLWLPRIVPVWTRPAFTADPFTLGVASGDPAANGVVLWTRLAPDPDRKSVV